MKAQQEATLEPLLRDYQVEAATNGQIKAERLRKDRRGAQLFPFFKLGRNVFYRLSEIEKRIARSKCGGKGDRQ